MKNLNQRADRREFFRRLGEADARALLLDYDGTLAPFREARDEAVPYPGVREALGRIVTAGGTRTVVISGRATADLLPLLGMDPPPEVWGTHGWERRGADGSYRVAPLPEGADAALDGLVARLADGGFQGQWERKPASVAVHWRGLPDERREAIRELTESYWAELGPQVRRGDGDWLALKPFDGGLELSVTGRNKGDAVRTVLQEMGAGTCAAYLGDDLTDEDAFNAIAGRGLGVLVRGEWRETAADWWIEPPGELLQFLEDWLDACGGR